MFHVGRAGKPEYCFSVITLGSPPVLTAGAREELANLHYVARTGAIGALQERARDIMGIYAAYEPCGKTWGTMSVWADVLHSISSLSLSDLLACSHLLEECLYAFLVIQAFAIANDDPVLLFTPAVILALQPYAE